LRALGIAVGEGTAVAAAAPHLSAGHQP
jgi:hypothetical protein